MLKSKQRVMFEADGTTLTAHVCGEIDHHSATLLRRELDDCIERHRPAVLRLDASAVDFMDSSGLGLILGRYATAGDLGTSLSLEDPSEGVRKILDLAGIERLIDIKSGGTI